ncbi:uncharacterized protein LOC130591359 [Beta vulgaris subsp. vulgaris]|uniref:uncharacterized protein LOC130591359 n=1 Tax=Beta vulgaris subsp. vulgaris TaxID=3555 RepID=UPI0025485820|nr:uncharacterized protein LOC130591359 [Beta vulgaris subsp. vulgaris]
MEYDTEDKIDDDDNDHVDEMMDGVEDDLGQHSRVFESLTEAAQKPLYPDAKNLRWHADGRKKDSLLKHPADSPEWKSINRLHKAFGNEDRNLRLGLCTDGMNPFGSMSSLHSTWPPGNDIDVYLAPLIDDLKKLWDEGVSVFDAHANEMFTLRAMLFCTINDFPAYGNLSGYKNKVLTTDHPFRKKKKAFYGSVEEGVARRPLTGKEVYEQLKGVETIFGKTMKEEKGLWKKESIFWTLPYWKDLKVRHCLDVMHIEKIKVLDPTRLDALQADVVETLCKFEMYFPPAFFDIMVHLIVHLVREIKLCGPVFLRWCYPFERRMGTLQDKVRNPAQPEASIIQGTVGDEVGNFVAEYLASAEPIGLPTSRHDGRLGGHGTIGSKLVTPPRDRRLQAHLYVLHHVAAVHPYLAEHMEVLRAENPSKGDRALMQLHNKTFIDWFHDRVICQQQDDVSETIKWLAFGPREAVNKYEGYDINGFTFWSEGQDEKSSSLKIVVFLFWRHLHFMRALRIGIQWMPNCYTMGEFKKYGSLTTLVLRLTWVICVKGEPFILATHAKQVFYVRDPADHKWCIVVPRKRSILGIGDVDDEEEYDAFEDSPPFINPKIDVTCDADVDTNYMRVDHTEGILVDF